MSVVYSDKQRSQYVAENDDIYIYIYNYTDRTQFTINAFE